MDTFYMTLRSLTHPPDTFAMSAAIIEQDLSVFRGNFF